MPRKKNPYQKDSSKKKISWVMWTGLQSSSSGRGSEQGPSDCLNAYQWMDLKRSLTILASSSLLFLLCEQFRRLRRQNSRKWTRAMRGVKGTLSRLKQGAKVCFLIYVQLLSSYSDAIMPGMAPEKRFLGLCMVLSKVHPRLAHFTFQKAERREL